jgi:uncharacterized protein YndB with AHSA1/START domain
MKILTFALALSCASQLQLAAASERINPPEQPANPASLMGGKLKTDRTVFLEAIVAAPPSTVFELWTSRDGIKKFFAPDARIDASVGGRYQIIFAPTQDPEGDSHGTKGARILKLVPNKELAFEWITFAGDELLGKNAPPYAPAAERNVDPLPTWVELTFENVEGEPNKTHLRFAHYGFRQGEKWERSYQWFARAWKGVLNQLSAYCEDHKSAATEDKLSSRRSAIVVPANI